MNMYDVAMELATFIKDDTDVIEMIDANFDNSLTVMVQEDYNRMSSFNFPYLHLFCYQANTDIADVTYSVVIELSSLRKKTIEENGIMTEQTAQILGLLAEAVKKSITNNLSIFGLDGDTRVSIISETDVVLPPQGEEDMRYVIELQIQQKKCKGR